MVLIKVVSTYTLSDLSTPSAAPIRLVSIKQATRSGVMPGLLLNFMLDFVEEARGNRQASKQPARASRQSEKRPQRSKGANETRYVLILICTCFFPSCVIGCR